MAHLLKVWVKQLILDICAEAATVFDSFKRLWALYFELVCLLRLYVKLGPRERWLRKLSGFLASMDAATLSAVFQGRQVFCGVYAWVSVVTGQMYVGSSVDFRQRVYAHVRCVRGTPKQQVHRFLRSFGRHLFVPVPLVACPRGPLRLAEESVIGVLQPGLNREWMPCGGDSRRARALLFGSAGERRVLAQRVGRRRAPPAGVCSATFLAGGLRLPSVSAALVYAQEKQLQTFSLCVSAGSVHLSLRHQLHRVFDSSCVSVEGHGGLQQVSLAQCWSMLLMPLHKPLVLHVHSLKAVGWRLWAADTLAGLTRQPHSRRDLYRLSQLSLVRLWRTAQSWDKASERQKLLQWVAAACRKVHGVDLRLSLVVRVPFGLQHMHHQLVQSLRTMVLTECTVHPEVSKLWVESIRVVQTQGRSVSCVLGSFRRWCKQLDCSPEASDSVAPFAPKQGLDLPQDASGAVCFRGDNPLLPAWLRLVTRLHGKFIPTQNTNPAVSWDLARQLCTVREQVGLPPAPPAAFQHWIGSQLASRACIRHPPGSVPMSEVLEVKAAMTGLSGHLVGVPIDKNRILYFEDAVLYRRRLIQVFIQDTRHYQVVPVCADQLVQECLADCTRLRWDRFCTPSQKGHLGFAQCLPKDKDCSLSRPLVPNCAHPLARLFNMAARGLAFMLMHVKLSHYNLFTTQEFVAKLAADSEVVADFVSSGQVQEVCIAQSDVKDMYTEISHAEIESCVSELLLCWRSARKPGVLNITKRGRKGVAPGYTCDRRVAASMRVETIVQIVLYELRHAFFHVGCKHIMQQVIGVSMGSKGGPVLAWCVCMVNEHRFHSSLGVDSRYIRVYRYFDDVWQLLMVPSFVADSRAWVDSRVAALQHDCYPASLRLIQNSLGPDADMLACTTRVVGGELCCVHRSKNAQYIQRGLAPRFACFLPFFSAHARRRAVMGNGLTGLLHRVFMDTQPKDVPLLLPVLLSYDAELSTLQYPSHCLLTAFRKFLLHTKVSHSEHSLLWRDLYFSFAQHKAAAASESGVTARPFAFSSNCQVLGA